MARSPGTVTVTARKILYPLSSLSYAFLCRGDGQPPTTRRSHTPSVYCGHLSSQDRSLVWNGPVYRGLRTGPHQLLRFPAAAFSVLNDDCIFISVRCKAVADLPSLEVEGLEVLRLECALKFIANEVPESSMSATD